MSAQVPWVWGFGLRVWGLGLTITTIITITTITTILTIIIIIIIIMGRRAGEQLAMAGCHGLGGNQVSRNIILLLKVLTLLPALIAD